MAETSSQTIINEPSADVKPFLEFLRNAAFGLVFTPQAIQRAQLPGSSNFFGSVQQQQPTFGQTPPAGSATIDVPFTPIDVPEMRSLARSAQDIENRFARTSLRYADGGRLARSAQDLEKALADVMLGPGGTPLGNFYEPLAVSPPVSIPSRIGTGVTTPPPPRPPSVTPPLTAGPGGLINTPVGGPPLVVGNPNPSMNTPAPGGQPPAPGGQPGPRQPAGRIEMGLANPAPAAAAGASQSGIQPLFTSQQPQNFAGAAQAQAQGYNPSQYADQSVAEKLAQQMGGNVQYTNVSGPIGPPSQATLNFGGAAQLNAGLVNKMMAEENPGLREMNLKSLREEIARLGGTATFAKGGAVRAQTGMFNETGLTNLFSRGDTGGGIGTGFGPTQTAAQTPATNNPFGQQPQFNAATGQTPTTQLGQGANVVTVNPLNPPATDQPGVAGMAMNILNPYQRYPGQRTLTSGANFGQIGQRGEAQISDPTRMAIQGLGRLPSYFDEYGNLQAGRTPSGQATTSFGIANDIFDVAGNQALGASQTAESLFGRNDIQSTFGETMKRLQQNPALFQAGDITLGQLAAPQLDQPQGISPSQLTSYQMAGPRLVDMGQAQINPLAVQGESVQGLPSLTAFQMDAPERAGADRISTSTVGGPTLRDIMASNAGMNVTGEGYGASRMQRPEEFIQPGTAQAYMSPYQRQVIDTQLQEARRAYDESRAARNAQAIRAGAFGGNRQAVAESIAARDLANQQGAIVAQGMQSAFENAQQQFERDRAAQMQQQARNQEAVNQASQFSAGQRQQANLANQANAQQFGLANLQSLLQTQQLGATLGQQAQLANQQAALEAARANQQTGLQAQLANQAAQQQAAQQNLAARLGVQELGAGQQFNAAQLRAQYGQQAQMANQQAQLEAARANQATGLQAQLANQAALQQANQQNLAAALGVQELGAQQALAAQQANQQAGLTAGQANLNAALATQQLGRQSGLSAAQANQQTRLAQNQALLDAFARADQLQQQAAQGNVGNRLAALGQQTQSALAANQIGQSRADLQRLAQAMELQNLQALQQAGAGIDTRTQQLLDLGYQDFINQRNFPYQQLNWLTGLLNQMPVPLNQEQVQFQRTNPLSQIVGLGTAGLGALTQARAGQQG